MKRSPNLHTLFCILSASRGGEGEEEEDIAKLLPFLAMIFQKGTDFVEIGALIE